MVVHEVKSGNENYIIREYAVTWLVVFPATDRKIKLSKEAYPELDNVIRFIDDKIIKTERA